MAIDITGLIIMALFFLRGYTKGLIVAVCSFLAVLAGIICSLKLSQNFGNWLIAKGYTTVSWAPLVSYLLLFALVVYGVRLLAKLVQKAADGLMLGFANRLAGGLLYAFAGAVLFSSLLWIAVKMGTISPALITASISYPFFATLAPSVFSAVGMLLPFASNVFQQLSHFFDVVNSKGSQ